MAQGRIFDIQRYSVHDGPGIRTTVFLKGCPLRCKWCHNPEGISRDLHLSFTANRCILCGDCSRACPNGVHALNATNGHVLLREGCQVCGKCAAQCPAKALEVVGRDVPVETVLADVLRDRRFYESSGGGMTVSGGEPLLQVEFTEALLSAAKAAGLHTAIETCGYAQFERLERVMPYVDLFLYDIKETDDPRHREFTGVPNVPILANLKRLHDSGARILVRLPTIPGLNDRPEHFESVARLAVSLPRLAGVEVMPYHRLGTTKRERMGLAGVQELDVQPPSDATVAGWVGSLRGMGVRVINEV